MSEISRICALHERTLHGDAWHGDPVWKILEAVTPEQAFEAVIPAAHTIWQLVAHMTFWEKEVLVRIARDPQLNRGDHYKYDNNICDFQVGEKHYYESYNFPDTPPPSPDNWSRVLDSFRDSNTQFAAALARLADADLDLPLSAPDKSVYLEVHGVIQHHLYHAGQIAILLKNWAQTKVATRL